VLLTATRTGFGARLKSPPSNNRKDAHANATIRTKLLITPRILHHPGRRGQRGIPGAEPIALWHNQRRVMELWSGVRIEFPQAVVIFLEVFLEASKELLIFFFISRPEGY
jgi:hypothetical protein